ncbi:transporter substrate-binding domain-containing protein [Mitsuaria sp. GD03876]|uniref:substrate-binding periplasmic protein n=1 Tax=Mitsuaria sp. GD03876 TaxID=2975399 RepID=UPI00244B67E4|nr:transporter substrate-binding domain-containing protein [Mitsuaria sp. GD03876]MDH0863004.1 transporter substrate-binding domain-containing protein [Mitsuaria sp. GD03876]
MTTRRDSLVWLAAAAAATALPARAAEGPVRMVATEFPPYTGSTLPGGGVACEITRAALAQGGHSMLLSFRPWARALLEFQRGDHDGVIGAWRSEERERTMRFPQPLGILNQIGFMARVDRRRRVDDLAALRHLRIGVVHGYANPARFENANLAVEGAVDDLANLRKLLAGRVDLALIDKGVGAHLLETQLRDAAGKLAWLEPAVSEVPLYTVFSKTRPEGERLAAALSRGIGELQGSGRLALLLQQGARWQ